MFSTSADAKKLLLAPVDYPFKTIFPVKFVHIYGYSQRFSPTCTYGIVFTLMYAEEHCTPWTASPKADFYTHRVYTVAKFTVPTWGI